MPVITTPDTSRSVRPGTRTSAPSYRSLDADLRTSFAKWVEDHPQFTRAQIGRMLGFPEGTAVTKYLNDRYDRDPADIESRIAELLKSSSLRRTFATELVDTNIIRLVASFAGKVTSTGQVGVLTGDAGIGKTRALEVYARNHPTAVLLSINPSQACKKGVRQLLWGAIDSRGCGHSEPRIEFLTRRFRGSNRLLMIDGAQYLEGTGRAFLYTFHDMTDCPILLVGNPRIIDQVERDDQEHSRTIQHQVATLKEIERVTRGILSQHLEDPDAILDLAVRVVLQERGGHLRALEKLLICTTDLMEIPANADKPRECFIKSLSKSVAFKDLV